MEKYFFAKNEDEIKNLNGNKIVLISKVNKKSNNGFVIENGVEVIYDKNVEENSFVRIYGKVIDNKIHAEVVQIVNNIFKDICILYYEASS
ncbi:MAG: hypothetical protein RMJ17_00065 [Candidatus Aenigmarchaeota archaeon]|nr:hypothetical protein [Candidatus Aenigmarchaeota archaeon]MDW8148986.1 hypothetical protein [Candidatus Aenigmarchaeota archaeon]